MKIIETTFEKLPTQHLLIGFEGENQRATVRIDCASVFAEYPNATPSLIVKPMFLAAYPVMVDRNETYVDWLITSKVLSFTGDSEIQLVFYEDEVICKSAVSKIQVSRSLQATSEKPDPIARWIDAANQKLIELDAAIESVAEMDAVANGLPEGAEPTVEISTVDDHKQISFGIPKGDRGEVGATPQMSIGTVQTLPAGSSAASTITGTAEEPVLNLGIPKGDKGDNYVLTDNDRDEIAAIATEKIDLSEYALKSELPTKVSELANDNGYLTSFTETDPTVPQWAKAATKPSYNAAEVGALPSDTHIPSTTAELTNDAGFITNAALPTKVSDLTNDAGYLTAHQDISGKADKADLAAVATSGSYNDLTDKPEIPEVPVQDVQVNGVSVLQDGVANVPLAKEGVLGVIQPRDVYGTTVNALGQLITSGAKASMVKEGTWAYCPLTPNRQHESTFYGLAKAAGYDEKDSTNPVGTYTAEAKAAIQNMLDVPSKADVPEVPVQDVQVNGTSILQNGIANVPAASASTPGAVSVRDGYDGVRLLYGHRLTITPTNSQQIKNGNDAYLPVTTLRQHESTFYGLAKASGDATQSQSSNAVGSYTPEAKGAIQKMLGVSDLIATEENNLTASKAYAIGDIFVANGKLYKATAAIAQDAAIILPNEVGANCVETTIAESGGKIKDVQIGDFSAVTNGIAKINVGNGLRLGNNADHAIMINEPNAGMIRNKSGNCVITPYVQHIAVFYGLASLAGDTTQAAIAGNVGTYTEEAKTAIKAMLGVQDGLKVVRLI